MSISARSLTSFFFSLLLLWSTTGLSFAQATPAASESATTATESAAVIDRLKSLLQQTGEVAGALTDLLDNRTSFTGEVTRVSQEAITVRQFTGTTIVPLSEDVQLLKANKAATADQVEVGGWVTVMGTPDDNTVAPEFVLISTESLLPKDKTVALGTITEITRTKISYLPRGNEAGAAETVLINKNTVFENSDGTVLKAADFEVDYSVLIVAQKDANQDEFTVTTLHALSDVTEND